MLAPSQVIALFPNHQSFCDTRNQKIFLIALGFFSLGACALGTISYFKVISPHYQGLGWGLFSVSILYPASAGIAYLINKRFNPSYTKTCNPTNDRLPDLNIPLQNWDKKGALSITSDNFIHIKVDDTVFDSLYQLLKNVIPHLKKPFQPGKNVGAHVTVISPAERGQDLLIKKVRTDVLENYIRPSKEKIPFEIIGYKVVYPENHRVVKAFHVIQLKSLDLENLRKSHNLSPKMKDGNETIEFHVTIGEELKPK